ncbi:MAG: hypothetical protein A2096_11000 [Spirochaetes bacterium GWF1_41_5]|nr:MAG: hypothetical protein A2096_11000 [Spirochaetes bacterium GWF1_41_5]HBE01743.1 hypothetical protein [Spirochaetia bacterium]
MINKICALFLLAGILYPGAENFRVGAGLSYTFSPAAEKRRPDYSFLSGEDKLDFIPGTNSEKYEKNDYFFIAFPYYSFYLCTEYRRNRGVFSLFTGIDRYSYTRNGNADFFIRNKLNSITGILSMERRDTVRGYGYSLGLGAEFSNPARNFMRIFPFVGIKSAVSVIPALSAQSRIKIIKQNTGVSAYSGETGDLLGADLYDIYESSDYYFKFGLNLEARAGLEYFLKNRISGRLGIYYRQHIYFINYRQDYKRNSVTYYDYDQNEGLVPRSSESYRFLNRIMQQIRHNPGPGVTVEINVSL